ncbi:MAG: tRNA pseudouridine(38-40) synthase TruA [Erysipelotrichaceae bacterium]|nr:tRNA pseudouridine(38-40) synthase TruA [Erysipelotrichaceae bacterium]
MRRFKCIVAYDGTNYSGWQSQKNAKGIQDIIEEVISRIAQEDISITGAGRTDAKVHARGQCFHFDTEADLSAYKWKGALNGYLPKDIYIVDVQEVDEFFHARFCVKEKTYEYRIHCGEYDVFKRNYAAYQRDSLDLEAMKEASRVFIGTKDFTSFNASPLALYPDQVRTVYAIDILEDHEDIVLRFKGKGFLRYMVRMMSAMLIEVGNHRATKEDIEKMLNECSKTACKKNAPAQGLTLVHIDYFELYAKEDHYLIREAFMEEDTDKLVITRDDVLVGYVTLNKDEIRVETEEKLPEKLLEQLHKKLSNL